MRAEHPGVAAAGVHAELQEPGVEPGRARGEAHVAHERQVHARADGGAVDRGDRRQRRPADAQEALVDRAEPGPSPVTTEVDEVGPAQNAGGAPVTTTAPTASSASMASNVATISSTIGG